MTTPANNTNQHQSTRKPFTIRVLGVGGAGCNAVNHLSTQSLAGLSLAVLNTDAPALERSRVEARLCLGARTTRGLGAGGDPERGRAAATEDAEQINQLCTGADVVFVVAGLGGGTGTGAGPVVAQIAKDTGALVLGIVMLPFECEGGRRNRQAQLGLHELKTAADGVICLPNQKVLKLIDDNTSLLDAFNITNELVAQGVRSIWRLLSRPGLINVDFADLCAVTQGKHSESCLVTAQAHGENRSREVMEKVMNHPLMDGGQVLAESSEVLVCIAGGSTLTMSEVTRIMDQINRQCEQAHIILGAAIDQELADQISVTLVACRRSGPQNDNRPSELHNRRSMEPTIEDSYLSGVDLGRANGGLRPGARVVSLAPNLSAEKSAQLFAQQAGSRSRKAASRMKQGQLPLEIVSRGRFEKSEPTIHQGQDLDMPTYLRRGVALN